MNSEFYTPSVRSSAVKATYSKALLHQWPSVSQLTWRHDWYIALWWLLKRIENVNIARGIDLIVLHYGLDTGIAQNLAKIGSSENPPLTRERVRQLISSVLFEIDKIEHEPGYNGPRPFAEVKTWFKQKQVQTGMPFVKLSMLLNEPEVNGFKNNIDGLMFFLNDAGIRKIMYCGEVYLYANTDSRLDITQRIQCYHKNTKVRTASSMATAVTYVPQSVYNELKQLQIQLGLSLNQLYENILLGFSKIKPWVGHKYFFVGTRSLHFRKKHNEWVQIGLYISKDVYKEVQYQAKKSGVSLVSFICKALAWGTSDDPSAAGVVSTKRIVPKRKK